MIQGKRRLLLVGGAGFVGRQVIRTSLEADFHVGVVDQTPGEAADSEWLQADVTDSADIARAIRAFAPSHVLHLAACADESFCRQHPVEAFTINTTGTTHVLEACRRLTPRPVVAVTLSSAIYGAVEGEAIDEGFPMRPATIYGATKAAADSVASAYADVYGLDVVRLVPFNIIGLGQSPRFVVSDWARQVASFERRQEDGVLRVGNLDTVRDFVDVRDAARAMLAALCDGLPGRRYNIASGKGVKLSQVIDLLREAANCNFEVETEEGRLRTNDVRVQVGSHQLLTRDTGWEPQISVRETVGGVLEYWRQTIEEGL